MITWKATGRPVRAKMSYTYEFLELELKQITRHEKVVVKISEGCEMTVPVKVNRLTFEDGTGTRYNSYEKHVDWVLPKDVMPTKNIYHLMNIEASDYLDETNTISNENRKERIV